MFPFPITRTLPAALLVACGFVVVAQESIPETTPELRTPAQPQIRALAVALAASNERLALAESERDRLTLQIESLGMAAIKGDQRGLQERFLKCVAALSQSEKQRQQLVDSSARLAESAAALFGSPTDPTVRTALEAAIKDANSVLAEQKSGDVPVSLKAARVVSYKSNLALAVANAGSLSGLRMGTPIEILRSGTKVGSGIIVDLRDRISGVLVTNGESAIKTGDSIAPEASSTAASTPSSSKSSKQ